MIQSLEQIGFSIEYTQDGSPTLRLPGNGESMHHSGGAAAETRYIYGDVIRIAHTILQDGPLATPSCKTCIVGLGLGYIEISWALAVLQNKLSPSDQIKFDSFEIVEGLKIQFKNWLTSNDPSIYDLVLKKLGTNERGDEVKQVLRRALQQDSHLRGDFSVIDFALKWNVICYDAFSRKTNEGLWAPDFMNTFLKNHAAEDCVLTTYACTRALRDALEQNGFTFFKRRGFPGKRGSTLALRGRFKTVQSLFQIS